VLAAAAATEPQSQHALEDRIMDAVRLPSGEDRVEGQSARTAALTALFHPAVAKNTENFGSRPDEPVDPARRGIDYFVQTVCIVAYNDSAPGTPLGSIEENDTFEGTWGDSVPLSGVGNMFFHPFLTYWDPARWNGRDYGDGEPLFPDGRYARLDIVRKRGDASTPFLTLYAVDDGGKWWLVAIDDPHDLYE
jgi:hypothetical protein